MKGSDSIFQGPTGKNFRVLCPPNCEGGIVIGRNKLTKKEFIIFYLLFNITNFYSKIEFLWSYNL